MSRTVKAPDVRRNEILDKAQALFYSKGYEQTSIRDIIDGVGIAKGTFYHYFASKTELLDELIERMIVHIVEIVEPIVNDESLNAIEKFHLFFSTIQSWKLENKDFLKDLLEVYFSDDNVLLRYKLKTQSLTLINPPMSKIIHQGIQEGLFNTKYPDDICPILFEIGQSVGETAAALILDERTDEESIDSIKRKVEVTNNSVERLLGAPEGSIALFDFDGLLEWFTPDGSVMVEGEDVTVAAAV